MDGIRLQFSEKQISFVPTKGVKIGRDTGVVKNFWASERTGDLG